MAKYRFLTEEWITEARSIREEMLGAEVAAIPHVVRMNQVITEVPFGDGDIHAHLDTSEGVIKLDLGHIEEPDLTVTLDYETAKAILVDGNPQAGMQAFMTGRIQVQGDITKLMTMASGAVDPQAVAISERIRDITE